MGPTARTAMTVGIEGFQEIADMVSAGSPSRNLLPRVAKMLLGDICRDGRNGAQRDRVDRIARMPSQVEPMFAPAEVRAAALQSLHDS